MNGPLHVHCYVRHVKNSFITVFSTKLVFMKIIIILSNLINLTRTPLSAFKVFIIPTV